MSYDTPNYKIIEKEDQFEIRLYEAYIMAKVALEEKMSDRGFQRIFSYISGNNSKKESIAMTVPVFNQEVGTKYSTAFVMPSKYKDTTLPSPDDPEIKIEKVASKKMAAYRFKGTVSQEIVLKNKNILGQWLEKKGYTILSEAWLARYNSPFSLPILRRNEILFEVAKKE